MGEHPRPRYARQRRIQRFAPRGPASIRPPLLHAPLLSNLRTKPRAPMRLHALEHLPLQLSPGARALAPGAVGCMIRPVGRLLGAACTCSAPPLVLSGHAASLTPY